MKQVKVPEPDAIYTPKEFANLIDVCVATLIRWDKLNVLKANRTVSGHKYYTYTHWKKYMGTLDEESAK